jgi:cell growth-regulating nucleolar protein
MKHEAVYFFLIVLKDTNMVSFNCDNCQTTVKKPKLVAHKSKCKTASFTCIDCSTTFYNQDFKDHTSCITEEQKYQKHIYNSVKDTLENTSRAIKNNLSLEIQLKQKISKLTKKKSLSRLAKKLTESEFELLLKQVAIDSTFYK